MAYELPYPLYATMADPLVHQKCQIRYAGQKPYSFALVRPEK